MLFKSCGLQHIYQSYSNTHFTGLIELQGEPHIARKRLAVFHLSPWSVSPVSACPSSWSGQATSLLYLQPGVLNRHIYQYFSNKWLCPIYPVLAKACIRSLHPQARRSWCINGRVPYNLGLRGSTHTCKGGGNLATTSHAEMNLFFWYSYHIVYKSHSPLQSRGAIGSHRKTHPPVQGSFKTQPDMFFFKKYIYIYIYISSIWYTNYLLFIHVPCTTEAHEAGYWLPSE